MSLLIVMSFALAATLEECNTQPPDGDGAILKAFKGRMHRSLSSSDRPGKVHASGHASKHPWRETLGDIGLLLERDAEAMLGGGEGVVLARCHQLQQPLSRTSDIVTACQHFLLTGERDH